MVMLRISTPALVTNIHPISGILKKSQLSITEILGVIWLNWYSHIRISLTNGKEQVVK
jgi:dUTPase